MPSHDIIVIGASAGGIEAVTALARGLPPDLPAAIFVVVHIPPHAPSILPRLISRAGRLPAAHAVDGESIQQGHIYVAPPDHHLLIEREFVRVVRGPKENRSRPAIDPLFRTAARAYGPRVVGVVLTGALDDGTAGLLAIKRRGGVAVVQDPRDALVPMMPESALEYVRADACLPLTEMAAELALIARQPAQEEGGEPVPPEMDYEADAAEPEPSIVERHMRPGKISGFTCPECKGPLWEIEDGELVRFRCREGHAFTGDSVLEGQSEAVEQALWVALETLTESALMARRLAEQSRKRHHSMIADHFEERARRASERADVIRAVLISNGDVLPTEGATGTEEAEEDDRQTQERPAAGGA